MPASVEVPLTVTIWESPQVAPRAPWEWEVVANGRRVEGRCLTKDEAIDRAMRQVELEVRSAR